MFLIKIWATQSVPANFYVHGDCQFISILAQAEQEEEESCGAKAHLNILAQRNFLFSMDVLMSISLCRSSSPKWV